MLPAKEPQAALLRRISFISCPVVQLLLKRFSHCFNKHLLLFLLALKHFPDYNTFAQTELMKHLALSVCLLLFFILKVQSQKTNSKISSPQKPKLVVGLVIDQMRWDYLYRYAGRYGSNGFKRLMNEGFNCNNTFINYTPTYTAVGHSTIYTGSVPAIHGIMGNNWFSRQLNRTVYCSEDTTVTTVGSNSSAGKMSPVNMLSTTVGDQLKLANNLKAKVIGIALKDRGSILPAGHSANAAYWFDNANGSFITSSYYMKELPFWVQQFNNKKLPDQYLQQNWNTLYPIETYTQSTADIEPFENILPNEDNSFPHVTANITKDKYNSFRYMPQANTITFDMAKAAIEGEQLGKDEHTDLLAISCSSTDYIGHEFGPNSIEIEDTYLRLDKDIASFLTYLDKTIGQDSYVLFLSSDHGAANIPGYLQENKIPAGLINSSTVQQYVDKFLQRDFKITNGISKVINYQVYLNHEVIKQKDITGIKQAIIEELLKLDIISAAIDLKELNQASIPAKVKNMLINGYNQKLSGDIQYIPNPQFFDGAGKGTSHGVYNNFDSHIPLLWYGWGIKKGSTSRAIYMTDIAATLSALLNIQMPSGSIGDVIEEAIK